MRTRHAAASILALIALAACTPESTKPTSSQQGQRAQEGDPVQQGEPGDRAQPRRSHPDSSAPTSATPALANAEARVSGPTVHKNLAVFVITSDSRDDTDYLTLDEGLRNGLVAVSEKAAQEVNELEIENKSDRALYVQAGDRVVGGKQDRIVGSSFVVPPRSGKQPVMSFCVEHGRWSGRTMAFGQAKSLAMAQKGIRLAAIEENQQGVWSEVAKEKADANKTLAAPNTNSSLTETLDSDEVKQATDGYVRALEHALDDRPDAVGIAFALNGKVVEVDVYPGRPLAAKLYPKLLASYALQAALHAKEPAAPVASADVDRFVREGEVRRTEARAHGGAMLDYTDKVESTADLNGKKAVTIMAK